jgi:hypothetical protein
MMTTRLSTLSLLVLLCCASFGTRAESADLTGVWSTDAAVCNKVFAKSGDRVSFAKDADLYGNGFIIEGKQIRGSTATCRIKATKEEGAMVHMIAACATDIMLSDIQLSVKIIDADTIVRVFPSMPDIENIYHRCAM